MKKMITRKKEFDDIIFNYLPSLEKCKCEKETSTHRPSPLNIKTNEINPSKIISKFDFDDFPTNNSSHKFFVIKSSIC